MYRNLAKAIAWLVVVGTTHYLNQSHGGMVWVITGVMAFWSLSAFDRKLALYGTDGDPGILPMATIGLPLILLGMSWALPGVYGSGSFSWVDGVLAVLVGLFFAACMWIPFLLYLLIDFLFDRFGGPRTEPVRG